MKKMFMMAIAIIVVKFNVNGQVDKSFPYGAIQTMAGDRTKSWGYSGDNGLAKAAQLNWSQCIAVDASGNYYIADTKNNVIRMVNNKTGIITTVVGSQSGTAGYGGDGGSAKSALLNNPTAVILDPNGKYLHIADAGNYVIRRVDLTIHNIITFAGN